MGIDINEFDFHQMLYFTVLFSLHVFKIKLCMFLECQDAIDDIYACSGPGVPSVVSGLEPDGLGIN